MSKWDELSMAEKAEMIKVAVRQGIINLSDIRQKYNEFAEGGSKEGEEEVNTIVPFTQKTEVVITPDTEYNQYLNTLPDNQRFTPNDKYDSYFYWKLNGRPRNFEEAYNKGMFHYDHSDNSYHANSIAFDDNTGVGYFMKPKTHDTVGYELDWFNKGLVTEEGGKQRPVTPEEAVELEKFRKNYFLTNDPDRPNYYRYQPIEKAEGGGIHIKPSHRGRLTELKKRTGKTEAELYNDGNPAHKKMVVFARNSRKWKHGLGGNLFELGGPQRGRMPAHPKNREKDPEAYDAYQKWQSEMQERQRQQEEQNRIYAEEKTKRNAEAAEELNRRKSVVMSALSDTANSVPVTSSEIAEAAEAQRQEKLDKAHELKMGLDATMTAAELLAAGYGVTRGLTHLNRYMARQATQSTGQAISGDAMRNLAKWNRRVARIDKPQVLMNGIGGTADAYQWYTSDNNFDAWENGLETGANAAGVVGGMNWFRNLPYLRRIGGDKIDAVLDGMGYSAAIWDIVKNVPPLSTALESAREESKR